MPRSCRLFRPILLISFLGTSHALGAGGAEGKFEALAVAPAAAPVDADPIGPMLAKPIIGPGQSLADTLQFLESSLPRMPRPKSAAEWEQFAKTNRAAVFERVLFRGQAAAWRDAKTRVEWLDTIDAGPGYRIKKLRYEVLPGLWIPALLYEPAAITGKIPVILNVNGHDAAGKAGESEQVRCINLAKRGMLAFHTEWFGMGQLRTPDFRHDQINHINLCGASGISTHYLAMTRAIDILLGLEHADPDRLAVTGLSGGGWQTIFLSAFDTRVKLSAPVAGYSSFFTRLKQAADLGDAEQTPTDLGAVTEYTIMTAMLAPRPALLIFNAKDNCCFKAETALPPLLEAAGPIYQLLDKPHNLRSHVNHDPGTHNYLLDNRQAFYRMVGDFFYTGRADYSGTEIPSDAEVKPAASLDVPLPADNSSLHGLALALSKTLPREAAFPADKAAATAWRDARRARIKEATHFQGLDPQPEKVGEETTAKVKVARWRIKAGAWAIPVVELTPAQPPAPAGKPAETTLIVADDGRSGAAASAAARDLLAKGRRVLLMDPLMLGEARFPDHGYLYALLISTIGERPLGIQAGQIAAVARLASQKPWGDAPVSILAIGPRSGVMALVAAAVEEPAIGAVEVRGSLGSLKELIETKATYEKSPELFCFGLLEAADIAQLAAACAPRTVKFVAPSERAKAELAGLKAWYKTWGVEID
jgi:hypothetical protein